MKIGIFAVRDVAADAFGNPMFIPTRGQAVRSFTDEVNRKDERNDLHNHPEDFEMYYLGEFDTQSGMFATGVPEQVVSGKTVSLTFQPKH